ncbi:methyl-accepting chemotaxis protein [Vitiosangium sp. GDMCC 1.1324]|uniref:methyl-accepting chemotaxis protein n=1 Tax=Vitiosangium sp. (strain GDMCC 1.1324) TaxID=2138576 RepID=UPI000D36EADC|nr:methyl-accepting chemotaxis protein [Vitiosangium sp. GDMCC 1.1324]PTL84912.1 methyl-accepting chemotaxis protein [Vitiosangium sp. GDMCC 1.1324]
MTFKQKVTLLPVVATIFLLAILLLSVVVGRDASRLSTRIVEGYTPALASIRSLDSMASSLKWNLWDACQSRDATRVAQLQELAKDFEEELARGENNPVMEDSRLQSLRESFEAFWTQGQLALELAVRQEPGAQAAFAQALERYGTLQLLLRGSGEWAQAGLEQSFGDMRMLQRWRQQWVITLVVMCIFALGVLSSWLVQGVVGPLTRLTQVTTRIATEGDLTQRIDVDSRDELGQLARGIEALVARLRTVPVTLQGTVDELTQAAGRLTEASQRQLAFLSHQSRSLSEAGSTISEIAQTSNLAASRAEMVLRVAAQADAFSMSGRNSIESSAQGLQKLRARVETLMRSVAHLSEQAARAGEIIGSVRDLADQSNVLALNASIEAARAGEEGRGFAVVAREMRALSGQSVQSTQRIGKILLEINHAIRRAVSVAEQDSQQMEAGITQVLTSADRLREITTVVHESSQAAKQIVASVTQQNTGIAQMTEVMTTLSQMMGDVVESTMNAEEAVVQVNTSLERLKQVAASFRV